MDGEHAMATVIIPARWGSTRFPGKPLALIAGKPLVRHVWERCLQARSVRRVIVATDDMRIATAAFDFGAEVALTRADHPSGTDRAAEVASRLPKNASVIVNVQGDEALVDPALIDRLAALVREDHRTAIATAASPLASEHEFLDPNIVKVVLARDGRALYFSRAPIPAGRDTGSWNHALHHHGIYAFRKKFLLEFVSWKPSPLEKLERLEQLRALEHGARIRVLVTKSPPAPGVDTPAQARALEAALRRF
jgi:3-deoxy-manno-octulosonate cytidylyltransferase (CMP-KDO synthetase)